VESAIEAIAIRLEFIAEEANNLQSMNVPRVPRNLIREFFPLFFLWIAGDLYVTAKYLSADSYVRLDIDLILLMAVIAVRLAAPASRAWEQIRWFFTPEVGGLCLFIMLCHFATFQSWKYAWLIALEATFWFCLARVCKLTWNTLGRILIFALIPFYVVHNLALRLAAEGIRGLVDNLIENGAGPFVFAMMLVAIMVGFASVDDRSHPKSPASPVLHD
jgi:hypothetical protein